MNLITSTIAGATFGTALTASLVWSPTVIIEQMNFTDFHMLKAFLTASGTSALFLHLLARANKVPKQPRPASLLKSGLPYDGNIIGGLMVGFGMTLAGACPGTILVQVATQTYPGIYSFAGAILGGIIYVPLKGYLKRGGATNSKDEDLYLYAKHNIDPNLSLLLYEATCVAIVGAATVMAPSNGTIAPLSPIAGGLAIGAAQLTSLVLRGQPVGISTAYEDIGSKVCGIFKEKKGEENSMLPTAAMMFAAGVMLGASALTRIAREFAVAETALQMAISPTRAFLGGVVMVFGARLASGCTSGHGISGMSILATSSAISVASMFAGGIGLAQLIS